jgi:hypothetical protein
LARYSRWIGEMLRNTLWLRSSARAVVGLSTGRNGRGV